MPKCTIPTSHSYIVANKCSWQVAKLLILNKSAKCSITIFFISFPPKLAIFGSLPFSLAFNRNYKLSLTLTIVLLLLKPNHRQDSVVTVLHFVHHQPQPPRCNFCSVHKCSVLSTRSNVVSEHNPGSSYAVSRT